MVTPPDPASFSASAVIFLEEAAAQIRVVTERTQWEDLLLNLLYSQPCWKQANQASTLASPAGLASRQWWYRLAG